MPRRGENIRKRADGRWEGRYKCTPATSDAKVYYKSVYGKSYGEVKQRLLLIRQEAQNNTVNGAIEHTFSECMTLWLTDITQRCKYSTCVKYQYICDCHLKRFACESPVSEITSEMCEKFLIEEQLLEGQRLSLSTMKTICHVINQILKHGKSSVKVTLPEKITLAYKYSSKEIAVFSVEEQRKLLDFLYDQTDRYKLGILICLFSGFRLGERCALRIKDIDMLNKCIRVSQTVQRIKSYGENKTILYCAPPKSADSIRTIPLCDALLELLVQMDIQYKMRKLRNEHSLWLILVSCCLVLLAFYGATHGRQNSPIHITEICINNSVCAYDDNGNYGADYVEVYNSSDSAINICGFGLSDDKHDLYKYVFEDITIEPKSTIIVWNSAANDDISYYRDDYIPRDIHGLSFGLSAGETLILTDAAGNTIEKITIPNRIPEGKVYASTIKKPGSYTVSDPSPYKVAEIVTRGELIEDDRIEQPVFSVDGGWYTDSVDVALSAPKGAIYYTLDGSEPDENALVFSGSIHVEDRSPEENIYASIGNISLTNGYVPTFNIDKATVIKAIAVVDGKKSPLSSQTYFIGLDKYRGYDNIAVMEITINPDCLYDYYDGIYQIGNVYDRYISKYDTNLLVSSFHYDHTNYAMEGRGWERPAKIEFIDSDHKKVFEQNIGIRIHGGWSTSYNQKSFNLYARSEYDGNDYFLYDFFDRSFNKVMLRTGGFRDSYATKMRDVFTQSLVIDRNVGIQRFEPCNVFINGEYWGLYNLQETIGTSYISAHYGIAEGNILIMKNNETNTIPEDAILYNEIVKFAANNDLTIEENYRFIEERIDIQSYIDYLCFEIYIGNCDSVANNFARWRSLKIGDSEYEDGRWR